MRRKVPVPNELSVEKICLEKKLAGFILAVERSRPLPRVSIAGHGNIAVLYLFFKGTDGGGLSSLTTEHGMAGCKKHKELTHLRRNKN